ncbi:MAG: translocation/assembly module TamB domain-containing protein [Candidatus Krumholzibacteriota bacterium]|nr:translocation/assembly module TamB domain-containing protein [Candidatus Krumholzibacteriota bacterium]
MVKRILKSRLMPWVSLILGLLLTAVILFLVIFHTDFFAQNAGRLFTRYLFTGTRFSLSVSSLGGNPLRGVTARGVRIRYQGEDYSYDVMRIEKIRCLYNLRSFFSGSPVVNELTLLKPHLWIKPDSTGNQVFPMGSGDSRGDSRLPVFKVEKLHISSGQIIVQGREKANAARNIDVEASVRSNGEELMMDLFSGRGEDIHQHLACTGINGNIRWVRGAGAEKAGKAGRGLWYLSNLSAELNESVFNLNGLFNPDSMFVDMNVKVDPLDVAEIAEIFQLDTDHYGELQGSLMVKGVPRNIEIKGVVNGIFSGYALEDFDIDLLWDDEFLRFISGRGRLNGVWVDGGGHYSLTPPNILRFDFRTRELNLADGFLPGKSMPETSLNGKIGIQYHPLSGELYFGLDIERGHMAGFPLENALLDGFYARDTLRFNRLEMRSPTLSFNSNGVVAGGDKVKFFFDLRCARGDTIFSYLGIDGYRGDLELNGIWEGSFRQWDLRVHGECAGLTYRNALIPRGEINLAVRKMDTYRVFFDLQGDSCVIGPLDFTGIDLSLEYFDDITLIKRLYLARPGLNAEMWGEVHSGPRDTEITLSEVTLETFAEKWQSSGNFRVQINDSILRFDDLQFHSRQGALYLDCTVDNRLNNIDGIFSFERTGLTLVNRIGLVDWPLEGRVRGRINCSGSLTDPQFQAELEMGESTFDSLAVDSLLLTVSYAHREFLIDSLYLRSPAGGLRLEGRVSGTSVKEIYRERKRALENVILDLEAACDNLSLKPFLDWSNSSPFRDGRFTGNLTLSDSLVHPLVGLEGQVVDLSTEYLIIPVVDMRARLEGDSIQLDGTLAVTSQYKGSVKGSIPLRKEKWFYSLDRSREMFLSLNLPQGDLAGITRMTDLLAESSGKFMAEFRIEGTPSDPVFLGQLELRGANFRFSGMEERFRDVNSRILLEDTLITVASLKGKEGKEGSFSCRGQVLLRGWRPRQYDLTISLDKCLVASIPDLMAIVSGDLKVGTDNSQGKHIPLISGGLDVNKCEIYYNIGDFTSEQKGGTRLPPSWLAEVDLRVTSDTWIKTRDVNVELQGQVTVHHDQKGTYLRGRLNLLRGWYSIYNNKFRVKSGSLEFVYAESFRPVIDIEAETLDPEGRKIFLVLAWHQDDVEPRVSLQHEDPGYSETDIWKMLGGGVIGSSNGEDSGWDAIGTAQNLAANYLERVLNSQMQGVTIELDTSGGSSNTEGGFDENETIVAIGKYLSEGLYVKYKQGLSISTARHIEVEYRISNLFFIRSQLIKYSEKVLPGKSSRSTDEINVDLKLRWEF